MECLPNLIIGIVNYISIHRRQGFSKIVSFKFIIPQLNNIAVIVGKITGFIISKYGGINGNPG